MNEPQQATVDISGASIHVTGNEGEDVTIGPVGIHVKDGDEEVHVTFSGIQFRDGHTNVSTRLWKPLLTCAAVILVFAALLTALIVSIIKLMM